jgi:hypothetical protein
VHAFPRAQLSADPSTASRCGMRARSRRSPASNWIRSHCASVDDTHQPAFGGL